MTPNPELALRTRRAGNQDTLGLHHGWIGEPGGGWRAEASTDHQRRRCWTLPHALGGPAIAGMEGQVGDLRAARPPTSPPTAAATRAAPGRKRWRTLHQPGWRLTLLTEASMCTSHTL